MPHGARARSRLLVLLVLVVALAVPAAAIARPPGTPGRDAFVARASRALARTPDAPPASRALIVRYRAGTPSADRAAIRNAAGLVRLRVLPGMNAEVVLARAGSDTAAMADFGGHPDVELVVPDRHRSLFADPTAEPLWRLQWGHNNAGQLVDGFAGSVDVDVDALEAIGQTAGSPSVVVAVIDDGVDFSHPELAGNAWVNPGESGLDGAGVDRRTNGIDDDRNGFIDDVNGWDFCHNDNTVHDFDEDWHGTAVAGIIAASIDGRGMAGVAPSTAIMALKFLKNPEDEVDPANPRCGWDHQAIAAINYAASFGVRIINASWGGSERDRILEEAIEASGALFVAAAGNDSRNIDVEPTYPAAFDSPNILSVGAIYNDGLVADFSNYGRVNVDLMAPGTDILAPCPADATFADAGTCWTDGTSFAAPYVTGAAALIGALNPTLLGDPAGVRSRLLLSGTPLASSRGLTATGRLVNARQAIDFTPPTLAGAPFVVPLSASVLGRSAVTTRVAWPAATDDLAMGTYRVEHRRDGGAWTVLQDGMTAQHLDAVIALAGSHEFRITPRDAFGNEGPPASVPFTPARYEQGSALATVTGTWRTASTAAASGGRTRYTTGRAAGVTFTFDGRAVAVVAPRGRARGSFKVYLDGAYVGTVSLYGSSTLDRQVVYASGWLPAGRHVLRLVNTWAGGRTRGELDAFVVIH